MQRAVLDHARQRGGVDHQAAVVGDDDALDPDVAGLAVDLDLADLRDHGLAAIRVGDAAARRDVAGAAARVRRRARIPAELLGCRLDAGDGARALEAGIVLRAPLYQLQSELNRI